jgi:hypothetical protein
MPPVVRGRNWQAIVDHNIVRKSNIDGRRYQLKIEVDPFFFPQDVVGVDGPVTDAPQATNQWVTLSPTLAPSSVPSDGPSLTPTSWDIDLNGGCRLGHDLYEVHMYDSWGDGWDQTMVTIAGIEDQDPTIELPTNAMTRTITDLRGNVVVSISRTIDLDSQRSALKPEQKTEVDPLGVIFQGGLRRGSHDYADVCLLPRRCYEVRVSGGEFLSEVSWDVRPARVTYGDPSSTSRDPVLGGGAPAWCTFSLPDEYGHHFCPNTCSGTSPPSSATATTNPPKVLQNFNGATDMNAFNQGVGEEYSQNFGATGSYMGASGVRAGGSGGSSVLSKFTSVQDEDSNN